MSDVPERAAAPPRRRSLARRPRPTSRCPPCLRRVPAAATAADQTVSATGAGPLTRSGRGPAAAIAARGAALDGQQRLDALTPSLDHEPRRPARAAPVDATPAATCSRARSRSCNFRTRGATRPTAPAAARRHGRGAASSCSATAATVLTDVLRPTSGRDRRRRGAHRGRRRSATARATPRAGRLVGVARRPAARRGRMERRARQPLHRSRREGVTVAPQRQRRGRRAGRRGAELVTRHHDVTTRFTEKPFAVAVVLDQPVGTETGQGLAMTLGGARTVDRGRRYAVLADGRRRWRAQRRDLPDRAERGRARSRSRSRARTAGTSSG